MRLMPALALGFTVSLGGAAMLAAPAIAAKKAEPAPAAAQLKPTPAFVKVYVEVDKAIKANDLAGAQAKLPEAEAAATSPDDKYLLGALKLNIALNAKDEKGQRTALEAMLASGKTAAADAGKFNFFVGQFALKNKEYDTAIKYLGDAVAAGYGDAGAQVYIAESYFGKAYENVAGNQLNPAGKQLANQGLVYLKKGIEAQAASGQPVDPGWYSRGFRMSALASSPDAAYWSATALKSDPNPENWRIALRTYQDGHKAMSREENLDLLRLMAASGGLKDAYSYGEYADTTLKIGLFGETKAIIDQGRSAGHLQTSQLADVYRIASGGIAADKASLGASEASAAKAATGKIAASTASAYLGYGDYAKAATLYRLALTKGGVDANEINTRLGIALAKGGDRAGAKTAFSAVTAGGARKEIAEFWSMWLTAKGA